MAAMLLLLSAGQARAKGEGDLMDRIEREVVLPPGAAPLSEYRRYYAWAIKGQLVWAVYALGEAPARVWRPKNKMPVIIDGGCRVVVFDFDVSRNLPVNVTC